MEAHTHTQAPISEQGAMQFDPKAERCWQPLCGQAAVLTAPPALEHFSEECHYLEVLAVHHFFEVGQALRPLLDEPDLDDGSPPWKGRGSDSLGPTGSEGLPEPEGR